MKGIRMVIKKPVWLFLTPMLLLFGCGQKTDSPQQSLSSAQDESIRQQLRFACLPAKAARAKVQPPEEQSTMAAVMTQLQAGEATDSVPALRDFVAKYPDSQWVSSLRFLLGDRLQRSARFSEAESEWQALWNTLKDQKDESSRELAELTLKQLLKIKTNLAKTADLESLIKETEGRNLSGPTSALLIWAKESLWHLKYKYADNLRCGPVALNTIQKWQGKPFAPIEDLDEHGIGPEALKTGVSIADLADLAGSVQMDYAVIQHAPGTGKVPTPAVMHWKFGHYSALVAEKDGRYLLDDDIMGYRGWVSLETISNEISGYFLVPSDQISKTDRVVLRAESAKIFGRHCIHSWPPPGTLLPQGNLQGGGDGPPPGDGQPPSDGPPPDEGDQPPQSCAMPIYTFKMAAASLLIEDTPVGYRPPVGPSVYFTISYQQMDDGQDATSFRKYGQLGDLWFHNYTAFVEYPGSLYDGCPIGCRVRGGGTELYTYSASLGRTITAPLSRVFLRPIGTNGFERVYPNGRKEVYTRPFTTPYSFPRFLLTGIVDSAGNQVTLNYDSAGRLATITDAIGQSTTLFYDLTTNTASTDFTRITRVADPFGRTASFQYTNGLLWRVTDVINLTSQFGYDFTTGFISSMTTPYTTTIFGTRTGGGRHGLNRDVAAEDANGQAELVAFVDPTSISPSESKVPPSKVTVGGVPVPMLIGNANLYYRNTIYLDKRAFREALNDSTNQLSYETLSNLGKFATIYHWLVQGSYQLTGTPESIKRPLESRVWYNYPGQTDPHFVGSQSQPSKVARVLDDGSTQLYQYGYNSMGILTNTVDPVGRTTAFIYDTNAIDLLEIRQRGSAGYERLAKFTYNSQHLPLTSTDASGQTTTNTYNPRGQLLTTTNPKGETTTLNYDTNGYLISIDGPLPGSGDSTYFTYDPQGRVRTETDPDGYVLTYAYDNLNRLTRVTYPDGTYEEVTFDRLNPVVSRDRLGRLTTRKYDLYRHLVEVQDPAGRVTRFDRCSCGALEALTDPLGRTTRWEYDLQGRTIAKVYVDGSRVQYGYEQSISRLKQVQDEKGQTKNYQYFVDDHLKQVSYPNALVPTPTVSYTYDTNYNRILTMTDGIGTTTYAYNPIAPSPTLGAGRLASVDGPWANDTISYGYDQLSRAVSRTINGSTQKITFDAAGRPGTLTNALGTFTYAFVPNTFRPATVTHSGGLSTAFTYLPNSQDRRLSRIRNLKPDGVTPISTFDYTYDSVGRIQTWTQQNDSSPAQTWQLGYDDADQLTSAIVQQGGSTIKSSAWEYDLAGNRTKETTNGVATTFSYNSLNEIDSTSGTLTPATYEWDAENRLTAINQGTARTEFSYDGQGRRVKFVEKTSGVATSTNIYPWDGLQICERRDGTGASMQQRYFAQGFQGVSGTATGIHLYTRDHLGSIRELSDTLGTLNERITYDAWGQPSFSSGTAITSFAYTGHFWHGRFGLSLAPYRAYSSIQGQWLSRDPLTEPVSASIYLYVENNPVNLVDPAGLTTQGVYAGIGTIVAGSITTIGGVAFGITVTANPITGPLTILGGIATVSNNTDIPADFLYDLFHQGWDHNLSGMEAWHDYNMEQWSLNRKAPPHGSWPGTRNCNN